MEIENQLHDKNIVFYGMDTQNMWGGGVTPLLYSIKSKHKGIKTLLTRIIC